MKKTQRPCNVNNDFLLFQPIFTCGMYAIWSWWPSAQKQDFKGRTSRGHLWIGLHFHCSSNRWVDGWWSHHCTTFHRWPHNSLPTHYLGLFVWSLDGVVVPMYPQFKKRLMTACSWLFTHSSFRCSLLVGTGSHFSLSKMYSTHLSWLCELLWNTQRVQLLHWSLWPWLRLSFKMICVVNML